MRTNIVSTIVLVLVNIGFFGWVMNRHSRQGRPFAVANSGRPTLGQEGPVSSPSGDSPGDARKSTPADHLPLAGMKGFGGGPTEGCRRLRSFLFSAQEELVRRVDVEVVGVSEIDRLTQETRCSLGEPAIRATILELSRAWYGAGLPPLQPFELVEGDLPTADEVYANAGEERGAHRSGGTPEGPHRRPGMIPMAGMPNYTAGAEQACPTLARLLDIMDDQIRDAGGQPPLVGPHRDRLLMGSCSVEDPTLAASLGVYRDTFGNHGLRPLPPFAYFASPLEGVEMGLVSPPAMDPQPGARASGAP